MEAPVLRRGGPRAHPAPPSAAIRDRTARLRGAADVLLRGLPPRELPEQLVAFLEHLPVGITITDAEGAHVYRNRVSEELTGQVGQVGVRSGRYSQAGQYFRAGTEDVYPDSELPLLRALSGESAVIDDIEVAHPQRGRVSLSARGAPLLDGHGRVAFAIVAFADVTAEKLLASVFHEQTRIVERERLAEGLHDEVIQLLAAARLQIGRLRAGGPSPAAEADALLDEATARLRLILAGLRPRQPDDASHARRQAHRAALTLCRRHPPPGVRGSDREHRQARPSTARLGRP